MSVVIVEGIDRVGKTTLALLLEKEHNAKIFKDATLSGVLERETVNEKIHTTLNMLTLWPKNDIIIIDRFHLSEIVYGVVDRGYLNEYMLEIDERLSKIDAKLILTNPTDVEWSSKQHGSDLSQHDRLFRSCFRSSKIKQKYECDYNSIQSASEWLKGVL